MRQAKALIRLHVCTGWSEALVVTHTILLEISCHGSNWILTINTLIICSDVIRLLPKCTFLGEVDRGGEQPAALYSLWAVTVDIKDFLLRVGDKAVPCVVHTACCFTHTRLCVRTNRRVRFCTIIEPLQCYLLSDSTFQGVHVGTTWWRTVACVFVSGEVIIRNWLAITYNSKT